MKPCKQGPAEDHVDLDEQCDSQDEACCAKRHELDRRGFIKVGGIAAALLATRPAMPVLAGPFEDENDYLEVIPLDKRLDPKWVRSLYERGTKKAYHHPDALRHIGMPVGGFFAGTVYLGGDGRLWLWNVLNRDQNGIQPRPVTYEGQEVGTTSGANFVDPARPVSPFEQGFEIRIGDNAYALNQEGIASVTFDGRYPIGRVTYEDPDLPVRITLEAFSPFIPLNLDDSSLPATVMSFRITNTSTNAVDAELLGHLENAVCCDTKPGVAGQRRNRVVHDPSLTALVCSAESVTRSEQPNRPDILFEDFEKSTYDRWTVEGKAFGDGPIAQSEIPSYQGDVGGKGKRVANSHASAPGNSVTEKDGQTGKLISRPFTISRRYVHLLIGGGSHEGQTCVNLWVEGRIVASVTGSSKNRMRPATLNAAQQMGKQAHIEIVDSVTGAWGNIGVDQIVFSDQPSDSKVLEQQRDFGTMTLVLIGNCDDPIASADRQSDQEETSGRLEDRLVGKVGRSVHLQPGEEATVDFVLTWHFPNLRCRGVGNELVGNHYASRFKSALDAARYLVRDFQRLAGQTRQWVETWYDSTLPYWLLDRTMANTSTLATTTCYRFLDGRFWAWEGIGCCAGTCTHVWHYAQAPGRLFPELERLERQTVNFGIGMHADGGIGMRTGLMRSNEPAVDGQCGRILGVLREHQMSADKVFLSKLWPNVKKAIEYLLHHDKNADGVLDGAQPNTLDAAWYGKISFTSSLYLAALRAGEVMAREMEDVPFAKTCRTVADKGAASILEMYNGEYFVQIENPQHSDAIGVGPGCYIDQVFGQTWAHWVGLGRLFDREKQVSALRALWKYNFVPDVGPFRKRFERGRWYAMAGDAGLLMCTWPKEGVDEKKKKHWQYMYFNECMTGFEWQAAAHMVWEGDEEPDLLQHGLAIGRAIDQRYDAALRNPYNEIECSDHYSRAMASYGLFQAVCGFGCHGPKGQIAFAPRLSPDDFRSAFTAAEGWGTFSQHRTDKQMNATIMLRYGNLRLRSLTLVPKQTAVQHATVRLGNQKIAAKLITESSRVIVQLDKEIQLVQGGRLEVALT